MDKQYFLKIIIPNYNNYIYIKKCLDSILKQTFQDWFCIIVDDKSTDNSDKIAQIYQDRYSDKFKLIKAPTKCQAGGCRNIGLKCGIQSKYTYFMDSDDELFDQYSLQQIFEASKNDPDIIECNYVIGKENKDVRSPRNIRDILFLGVSPWKHCISSRFDNIFFKENRCKSNDMVWGIRVFDTINDNKVSFTKGYVYRYRYNSTTSIQHSTKKFGIDAMESQRLLIDDLRSENYNKQMCVDFKNKTIRDFQQRYEKFFSINIQEAFKNSYVISIDDKKLRTFNKIFEKNFKNCQLPKLHVGSQDKRLTGPQNCTRSHIDIVKEAKQKNLPFVMIFEDDAYPCIDSEYQMQRYLNFIPNQTKLILLGWSNHLQKKYNGLNQIFDNYVNRITTTICGSHSYILFKSGYDDYLRYFQQHPNGTADCHIFLHTQPSYVIQKPIFIQYSEETSMNNHIGYIYYGNHENPPDGFPNIRIYDK